MGGKKLHGGFGLSVCLGDLNASEPFGEMGAGRGLRVLFRSENGLQTHPREAIEVWYADEALLVVPATRWLRTSSWVPVKIRHDADGLHVTHNDRVWVNSFKIRGWAPEPSWRLGFGARAASTEDERLESGDTFNDHPERHWIDDLHVEVLEVAEADVIALAQSGPGAVKGKGRYSGREQGAQHRQERT